MTTGALRGLAECMGSGSRQAPGRRFAPAIAARWAAAQPALTSERRRRRSPRLRCTPRSASHSARRLMHDAVALLPSAASVAPRRNADPSGGRCGAHAHDGDHLHRRPVRPAAGQPALRGRRALALPDGRVAARPAGQRPGAARAGSAAVASCPPVSARPLLALIPGRAARRAVGGWQTEAGGELEAAHLPRRLRQRHEPAPDARHQAARGLAVRAVRRQPRRWCAGCCSAWRTTTSCSCGPTAAPSSPCPRPRKRADLRGPARAGGDHRQPGGAERHRARPRRTAPPAAAGTRRHAPFRPAGLGAAGQLLPPAAGRAGAQPDPRALPGRDGVALLADRGAVRAARQRRLRARRARAHRRLHRARRCRRRRRS